MGVVVPVTGIQAAMRWQLVNDTEPMIVTLGLVDDTLARTPAQNAADFEAAVVAGGFTAAADMLVGYSRLPNQVTTYLPSGPVTIESGVNVAGTLVGNPLPNNCAVLVRKNTALGGRRNRGRFYLPPYRFGEDVVAGNGVIQPANVATLQNELATFILELNARNFSPVVWHSDGGGGTEILNLTVQNIIATQRTRMRR